MKLMSLKVMSFFYICNMENKSIIKVPVCQIKNNYSLYELKLLDNEIIVEKNVKKSKWVIFYLILFLFVGIPLTILIPFKTFRFFFKKTNLPHFDPTTYNIPSTTLKRIVFFIISLLIIIIFPYICFFNFSFFSVDNNITISYDWAGLYYKLKNEGYKPKENSYIKVCKYKNHYICKDGNHRHKILETFYPKDMLIDVIYVEQIFDKKK
jgi:hypothetical protein